MIGQGRARDQSLRGRPYVHPALQAGERGMAAVVQRDDLAVQDHRPPAERLLQRPHHVGVTRAHVPVVAAQHPDAGVLRVSDGANAVPLELVCPVRSRREHAECGQHWRDRVGEGHPHSMRRRSLVCALRWTRDHVCCRIRHRCREGRRVRAVRPGVDDARRPARWPASRLLPAGRGRQRPRDSTVQLSPASPRTRSTGRCSACTPNSSPPTGSGTRADASCVTNARSCGPCCPTATDRPWTSSACWTGPMS